LPLTANGNPTRRAELVDRASSGTSSEGVMTLSERAARIREHALAMAALDEGAHLGGSLSASDILTVLLFEVMRVRPAWPDWPERDYLVLSKGHASAALYAALAERGFFPVSELLTYAGAGSRLAGHPMRCVPGVEFPTGSLGHGLSLGVGLSLAARHDGLPGRCYVILGDGELQEGSVWEAAMAASALRLRNVVAIIDHNCLQINGPTSRSRDDPALAAKWAAFGWETREVDGHNLAELRDACLPPPGAEGQPLAVVARTVKGRGVPFLEGRARSHYVKLSPELHRRARSALSRRGGR
jgi:transketolase